MVTSNDYEDMRADSTCFITQAYLGKRSKTTAKDPVMDSHDVRNSIAPVSRRCASRFNN